MKSILSRLSSKEDQRYFPNRNQRTMEILREFRSHTEELSIDKKYSLFSLISHLYDDFVTISIDQKKDKAYITQKKEIITFPHPLPSIKFEHVLCGYEDWLMKKYSLPGFVEVEQNDLIIDCGAYVGGFSLSAAKKASELHLFEPDVKNYECCLENFKNHKNIVVNNTGLYNETKFMQFFISSSSVEHSLLLPDNGEVLQEIKLKVFSLFDYCNVNQIEKIDFLKLEAEGVEPEIFDGLKSLRPRKLAIDISPEREGQSPKPYFEKVLSELNYKIEVRGNVLFARHM